MNITKSKKQDKFGILDTESYAIFLLLQQNPLISQARLASELGVSTTMIKSRIGKLKETGVLRPTTQIQVPLLKGYRTQTEVEAVYDPFSLGLIRLNIFLEEIPSIKELTLIEKLLAVHPYTHYHVASFDRTGVIYCQLDIPPEGTYHVNNLFQKLKRQGLIQSYTIQETLSIARSHFSFDKFILNRNKWELYHEFEFKHTSMDTELDYLFNDFLKINQSSKMPMIDISLSHKFDKIDLLLLRELTVNSKVSLKTLSDFYDLDLSRISRRVRRLRERVTTQNQLYFDQSKFDLSYPQIVTGDFDKSSNLSADKFYSFVTSGMIPFSSTAVINEDSFIWLNLVPPSYAAMFSRFAWQNSKNARTYQIDLNTSQTYYFYHENFEAKGKWKISSNYIVETPLESMYGIE